MFNVPSTKAKYKRGPRGPIAIAPIFWDQHQVGVLDDQPERIVAAVNFTVPGAMAAFVEVAKANMKDPPAWLDSDEAWASEYARQLLAESEQAAGLAIPKPLPPPTTSQAARDFYGAARQLMENLYGRWLDEKDYEDIKDYTKPIQDLANTLPSPVTIGTMTKRPFGCYFHIGGRTYQISINSKHIQYKRVA